jgi:hypothetical protein
MSPDVDVIHINNTTLYYNHTIQVIIFTFEHYRKSFYEFEKTGTVKNKLVF